MSNTKTAVDVRWMVGNLRGMGRYAHQLISPIKQVVLGVGPKSCICENLPYHAVGNGFFPWWEQFVFPNFIKYNKIKRVIFPYNTAPIVKLDAQVILVVHDLIYLKSWSELPPSVSMYQTLGRIYRSVVVPRVIRNADVLLTVSEFTKSEIIQSFSIDPDMIHVIPNSVNKTWYVKNTVDWTKRGNYCLTVAGEAPSKNVRRLIEAFALALPRLPKGFKLKIVGIKSSQHYKFEKLIIKHGLAGDVEFSGFVTDDDLKRLYQNAKCFVFASLFEGFGIPLIEAMASGTPIACSNTTSIPEVVGNAAVLFNPLDITEISSSICSVVNQREMAEKMIETGLERALLFNEDAVNKQFKDFWDKLDEK